MAEQVPFADVEFAANPEPRCPCVLLLDVSASMAGRPLAELAAGLAAYQEDLLTDSLARQRVEVAVVTFGGAVRTPVPFVPAEAFRPPALVAGGDTPMGRAVETGIGLVADRKRLYKQHGLHYFRPWLFLITDGAPTDDWGPAAAAVREGEASQSFAFFSVGVAGADLDALRRMGPREPVRLNGLSFRELFVWLSQSQRQVSNSRPGQEDKVPLANPAAPGGWASL